MKKAIQLLAIAACLVLSMAACQSNENKPTTTAAETGAAATSVPAPTTAVTTTPTTATVAPAPAIPTTKATVEPVKVAPVPAKDLTTKGAAPTPAPTSSTTATPATPAKSGAIVKWEETVHNWGSIKQGEKMTHIFKFKNTGSEPLIILDAKGSCGCTVPEKPAAPIGVGKTGEIKVVFDSNGKEGPQTKIVTVTTNTEPSNFALTIKGDVKKD